MLTLPVWCNQSIDWLTDTMEIHYCIRIWKGKAQLSLDFTSQWLALSSTFWRLHCCHHQWQCTCSDRGIWLIYITSVFYSLASVLGWLAMVLRFSVLVYCHNATSSVPSWTGCCPSEVSQWAPWFQPRGRTAHWRGERSGRQGPHYSIVEVTATLGRWERLKLEWKWCT